MGLTCDRDEGTIAVSVNGIDHGIMATNLPKEKDLFFAVDLSDEGQRLKILDERHSA